MIKDSDISVDFQVCSGNIPEEYNELLGYLNGKKLSIRELYTDYPKICIVNCSDTVYKEEQLFLPADSMLLVDCTSIYTVADKYVDTLTKRLINERCMYIKNNEKGISSSFLHLNHKGFIPLVFNNREYIIYFDVKGLYEEYTSFVDANKLETDLNYARYYSIIKYNTLYTDYTPTLFLSIKSSVHKFSEGMYVDCLSKKYLNMYLLDDLDSGWGYAITEINNLKYEKDVIHNIADLIRTIIELREYSPAKDSTKRTMEKFTFIFLILDLVKNTTVASSYAFTRCTINEEGLTYIGKEILTILRHTCENEQEFKNIIVNSVRLIDNKFIV